MAIGAAPASVVVVGTIVAAVVMPGEIMARMAVAWPWLEQ